MKKIEAIWIKYHIKTHSENRLPIELTETEILQGKVNPKR